MLEVWWPGLLLVAVWRGTGVVAVDSASHRASPLALAPASDLSSHPASPPAQAPASAGAAGSCRARWLTCR